MIPVERRAYEIRADGERGIVGVVARYGAEANLRRFRERIAPGAFRFSDVILNRQHDRALPLARTGGAGLTLEDSPDALTMRAEIPPTRIGTDALEAVRAGLLRGASVEMRVEKDEWDESGPIPVRTIRAADLLAIGLVDRPAYPDSLVEARAVEEVLAARPSARRRWR